MLFLPKNKGSLNRKESDAHNLAIRIKHLLTLKQTKDQPSWMHIAIYYKTFINIKTNKRPTIVMHIAIYWLGKDIYNYNKDKKK